MNHRPKPSRLFGFGRRGRAAAALDAADLGTAFGLEVSLDQPPLAAAVAQADPGTRTGWLRRIAARRQPRN
jgi:hypothetical protein